jgi:hypothetical protein
MKWEKKERVEEKRWDEMSIECNGKHDVKNTDFPNHSFIQFSVLIRLIHCFHNVSRFNFAYFAAYKKPNQNKVKILSLSKTSLF